MSGRRRIAGALALTAMAIALVAWLRHRPRPPAEPVRAARFTGTVRAMGKGPIAGAWVRALFVGADDEPRAVGVARSDAQGVYRLGAALPVAADGVVVLMAAADGYETVGRQVAPTQSRQDFVLAEGSARALVRVRDGDGAVVAGARVLLAIEPLAGEVGALTLFAGDTGSDGEASFAQLPLAAAKLHFSATAAGRGSAHGEADKAWGSGLVTLDVQLEGGARVTGEVVDKRGAPVAGATISVAAAMGPFGAHTVSDERGQFSLADVPTGQPLVARLDAELHVLEGGGDEVGFFIAAGARTHHLSLRAEPAGAIRGSVVGGGGVVGGAAVVAIPADHRAGARRIAASDGDGRFRIRGLRLDTTWSLETRHPDFAPAFVDGIAPARGSGASVTITLVAGGNLAGKVAYDDGTPAAGIEVYAHRVERSAKAVLGLREFATTRTRGDGGYEIDHLSPGSVRLEVRPRARMSWSPLAAQVLDVTVAEGETARPAPVTLQRGASLEAELAGSGPPAQEPIAYLSFMRAGASGAPHEVAVQRDGAGIARVDDLEPGRYDVAVRLPRHGIARVTAVELRPGNVAQARFVFADRVELRGLALRSDGRPAAGARVDLFADGAGSQHGYSLPGRAPDNFSGNFALADGAGRFVVAGLDRGHYHLRVTVDDEAPIEDAVDVDGTTRVTARFTPGGACQVQAVGADGNPLADRVVVVERTGGPRYSTSHVTDGGGVARFEHLAPGSYSARAVVDGQPTATCVVGAGQVSITRLVAGAHAER